MAVGRENAMDAITLLKADHKSVERLFKQFEKAGPTAEQTRRKIADAIIRELSVHAAIEEQYFYPAVRELVPDEEDLALESIEEHHIVKWVLSELDGLDPGDERFRPKMTVLIEMVRHHVDEEESDLFPAVRAALGRKQLTEIGEMLVKAKPGAPQHPHPRAPDTPPLNRLAGTIAGVVDRARDVATARGR